MNQLARSLVLGAEDGSLAAATKPVLLAGERAIQRNSAKRKRAYLVAARVGARPIDYSKVPAEPVTSWKAYGQDWANVSQGATAGRDQHLRPRAKRFQRVLGWAAVREGQIRGGEEQLRRPNARPALQHLCQWTER